jgi:hypothetical protein
MRLRC